MFHQFPHGLKNALKHPGQDAVVMWRVLVSGWSVWINVKTSFGAHVLDFIDVKAIDMHNNSWIPHRMIQIHHLKCEHGRRARFWGKTSCLMSGYLSEKGRLQPVDMHCFHVANWRKKKRLKFACFIILRQPLLPFHRHVYGGACWASTDKNKLSFHSVFLKY